MEKENYAIMPSSISKSFLSLPWNWYGIAIIVLILDQITKIWASSALDYNQVISVFTGFNITLRHNYGAAFSIFADGGGWQVWFLGILAAVVSIGLMIWIAKLGKRFSYETFGLALVLGGALGNLYDRVLYGYVVDFIEVYYQTWFWPAFNIADSAITCGAGLLIYDAVFKKKKVTSDE